jgi:hypothetical protein
VEESSEDPRLSKEPESGSPGFWEGYPSVVRLLFRPAGARSFSHLPTHGLRPFGKLRASCGLHSYAASRLRVRSFTSPRLHFTASSKVYFSRKRYPLLRRGIKSSVRGQGKSRTKSKAAGGGARATGAVLGGGTL